MSASPEIAAAFQQWRAAALAAYHACADLPDTADVDNDHKTMALIDAEDAAARHLATIPGQTMADILLKLLPLALIEHGPAMGAPPLAPYVRPASTSVEDGLWRGLIVDLRAAGSLAAALGEPANANYLAKGRAA